MPNDSYYNIFLDSCYHFDGRGMVLDDKKIEIPSQEEIISSPTEEIIQESEEQTDITSEKPTWKQRIAQLLQKSNTLMKLPFLERFVNNQLNTLPPANSENDVDYFQKSSKDFENRLSNNGDLKHLPPLEIQQDLSKNENTKEADIDIDR